MIQLDTLDQSAPAGFAPLRKWEKYDGGRVKIGTADAGDVVTTMAEAQRFAWAIDRPDLLNGVEEYTRAGLCPCCLSGGHPLSQCPGMETAE